MINIDTIEEIEKFDNGNLLESFRRIPDQIEQSWNEINQLDIPNSCNNVKNVVIAGMGGSALGGRIIDSLIAERSRVPIEVFNEYHIPKYVNKDTLIIISSYSGSTEETISDFYDAINRNAQIYGITTGGKLKNLFEENNIPAYIFDPKNNPSNQPRFGLGYSISSILAVLSRCGFIATFNEEIEILLKESRDFIKEIDIQTPKTTNIAKNIAENIRNYLPVIVSSGHLNGSSHAFKNILNETSKTFSSLFDIPELNHHLMEGLNFPHKLRDYLKFIFIESDLFSEKIKKRFLITREVVEKHGIRYLTYNTKLETKLMQALEIVLLGSYVSFYLALLYGTDPKEIPWVDYFKEKLK